MELTLKKLVAVTALAVSLGVSGAATAQSGYGGYGWSGQQGQQPMMGQMMNQGGMMVPRNMMGQGGNMGQMMHQGAMMRPGSMMGMLSEQQREQMQAIAVEFGPKFIELQSQMMTTQKRMGSLLSAEEIDQAELDSITSQMGNVMAEMLKLRVQHMARMRSIIPQELRQQMGQ